jgi:hypothetical protein
MKTILGISTFATFTLFAHLGFCTPGFPSAIKSHLGLAETPPCTLCHASLSGGGSVVTPFGQALLERGLVAGNSGSLNKALDQLQADAVDSNGNGQTDIEDLKAGVEPSKQGDLALNQAPTEEYGCVGQIAPGSFSGSRVAVTGSAAILFALWRRRQRR